jgi:pyrroline-5-carboxylate reductase
MKKNKIGIIGGGNMGEALIKGLVGKKLILPTGILVCEADTKRVQYLKGKYRIGAGDLNTVIAQSSTVVLAVKPQDMENVLLQIKEHDPLFISIAAGLTTKFFEKRLGGKARVVRAMPNMPALISEGITGVCRGRYAALSDAREAMRILAAVGGVLEFQEKYMDAITAVSGSGPAYVFLFVEAWMAAARALGLKEQEAKNLVYETLTGSAHLLKKSELTAGELRIKVTSKGGTTQAAMDVFAKGKIEQLMKEALSAAKQRAKELAK